MTVSFQKVLKGRKLDYKNTYCDGDEVGENGWLYVFDVCVSVGMPVSQHIWPEDNPECGPHLLPCLRQGLCC